MTFTNTYVISVAGQELLRPGGIPTWFVGECCQSEPASSCRPVGWSQPVCR